MDAVTARAERRDLSPDVSYPCRFHALGSQGFGHGHAEGNGIFHHLIIHGRPAVVGAVNHFLCKHPFYIGGILFKACINEVHRRLQLPGNDIDRPVSLGHQFHFIMRELAFCFIFSVHCRIAAENDQGLAEIGRLDNPCNTGDADCHFLQLSQRMDRFNQIIHVKLAGFHHIFI